MPRIGKVLQEARLEINLSLGVVAKQASMTPSQLSRIESGKSASPEFITVARVAAALNLSLDTIAVRSGAPGHERPNRSISPRAAIVGAISDLSKAQKSAKAALELINNASDRLDDVLPDLKRTKPRSRAG
jgi:transcriptional regulator with XRE-family HTH domain